MKSSPGAIGAVEGTLLDGVLGFGARFGALLPVLLVVLLLIVIPAVRGAPF